MITTQATVGTELRTIKMQHFITWATESDNLKGVLDGIFFRALCYMMENFLK